MHLLFSSCFYFFLFLFGFSTVCCDVNRYCFVFILIGVCRIYWICGLMCWFLKKIKFGELYIHYIISLYYSNIFHYITPFSFLSFHDSYIKYIGLLDIVIEAPLIFFSFPFSVFQFVVSTASSSSSLTFPSVVTIMLKNSPSELFISNTVSSSSRLYIVLSNSFYLSTEIIHKFTCHVSLYL